MHGEVREELKIKCVSDKQVQVYYVLHIGKWVLFGTVDRVFERWHGLQVSPQG